VLPDETSEPDRNVLACLLGQERKKKKEKTFVFRRLYFEKKKRHRKKENVFEKKLYEYIALKNKKM
jgi:hypothetical protein